MNIEDYGVCLYSRGKFIPFCKENLIRLFESISFYKSGSGVYYFDVFKNKVLISTAYVRKEYEIGFFSMYLNKDDKPNFGEDETKITSEIEAIFYEWAKDIK